MVMKKKAFTMIELVMVIVVLGIVASIGSEIILSLYNNYLRSRAIHQLESQTEIVLEQIAKRLQYRIKDSTIARKVDGSFIALSGSDSTYSIIEWIGYSNESLLSTPPGWSGLIDLDHASTNKGARTLKTPDSNLSFVSDTMSALTNGDIDLSVGQEAALIFKTSYNAEDFGWGNGNVNTLGVATLRVTKNNTDDDILIINAADVPNDIYEHYVLAHSAYAIVPSNFNSTDFNLTLRYNYQPWNYEDFDSNPNNSALLAEHASLFQFKQDDTVIRLKLCLHDNNETGTGDRIAICKEKVVY